MNKKLLILDIILIVLSIILYLFDLQKPIDNFIYSHFIFNDTLTFVFKSITILGNGFMISIVLVTSFIYFVRNKRAKEGLLFVVFTIISYLVVLTLKALFKRERPTINQLIEITGFSFPSGHAYISMVVYGYIIYLISKETEGKRRTIFIFVLSTLVFLIGVSRIYLGVHYLTDILFGYSLGLLSLVLFINFVNKRLNRNI